MIQVELLTEKSVLRNRAVVLLSLATLLAGFAAYAHHHDADDRAAVGALDTRYQAAVERNDAEVMSQILDPNFVLALGDGRTNTKSRMQVRRPCAFLAIPRL